MVLVPSTDKIEMLLAFFSTSNKLYKLQSSLLKKRAKSYFIAFKKASKIAFYFVKPF